MEKFIGHSQNRDSVELYEGRRNEWGAVQPDVRRLVDLINHLLNENRVLREELSVRQSYPTDDIPIHAGTRARQGYIDHAPDTPLQHRSAPPRTDDAPRRPYDDDRVVFEFPSESIPPSEPPETVLQQIDELRTEVRELKAQVDSLHKLQSLTRVTSFAPTAAAQSARLQPIELKRQQVSLESDGAAGMWMKLRQPWFYIPLIWVTVLGLIALIVFVVFSS